LGKFDLGKTNSPADEAQIEIDLVADLLHGWDDEFLQAGLGVGALGHDVCLERDLARGVPAADVR